MLTITIGMSGSRSASLGTDFEPGGKAQAAFRGSLQDPTKRIVFAIGSPGTAKTTEAIREAVRRVKDGEAIVIAFVKPATTAGGESHGYLPGGLLEKLVMPFLPLFQVAASILGLEEFLRWLSEGRFILIPLAYARGVTISDATLVIDEAQNCSSQDLELLLGRAGYNTRVVVTGDPAQCDIRGRTGLDDVRDGLFRDDSGNTDPEIAIHLFSSEDVLRGESASIATAAYERMRLRAAVRAQNG
jgi:phosphate starvation-inducible PhoH-like protein